MSAVIQQTLFACFCCVGIAMHKTIPILDKITEVFCKFLKLVFARICLRKRSSNLGKSPFDLSRCQTGSARQDPRFKGLHQINHCPFKIDKIVHSAAKNTKIAILDRDPF